MKISADFVVPLFVGRLTDEQRAVSPGAWKLAALLGGMADKGSMAIALQLSDEELLAWLNAHERTVRGWWAELVATGWVTQVRHTGRGVAAQLGPMYGMADAAKPVAAAVQVHSRVFGVHLRRDDRRAVADAVGAAEGNLKRWAQVCHEWKQTRQNPYAIGGLLVAYRKTAFAAALEQPVAAGVFEGWKE